MKFPLPALLPILTLLLLSLACTSVRAQTCTQTTIRACDDGDPCSENDQETIDSDDGTTICIPCAGTPLDCASGSTTIIACDDGNPATFNDQATVLDCDGSVCIPCVGAVSTCDNSPNTISPCDDGDPCTRNDTRTTLDADGSICVPCAGTPLDCATGPTLVLACNDGDPSTFNDELRILLCDGSVVCVPCMGTISTCDNSATTTRPCNDRDPCTENDARTTLDADGSVCAPCAGTPIIVDCTSGATTTMHCDDGDPATIDDVETTLDCTGTVCLPCAGRLPTFCDDPVALIDLEANAVRARLTTNGSLWNGTYAVTNEEDSPGVNPVNAISTGAFWMGGRDPGGGLFVRSPLYSSGPGNYGYHPGPLINGQTGPDTCARWDRFFVVTREEERRHHDLYWEAIDGDTITLPLPLDSIPASFLSWPGAGNPYFEAQNGFPLHDTPNGLAPFYDQNLDGIYDPANGDYPYFCGEQGIWSVFNTSNEIGDGTIGSHKFQIDVMASAPGNADADLQRTTYYTYTVRSFAEEDFVDAYVGHFIDSDLGCAENDRTGSIPQSQLFYVYNDENTESDCPGGEAGYGESNPVNVFQVVGANFPSDFEPEIFGIQRHITFYSGDNNDGFPAGTHEPATPEEAYNYLQGRWRDGSPLQRGGNGYDQNTQEETLFSFDGVEANGTPWRSCSSDVPATDVRSVYSMGPFRLQPGGALRFTLAVTTMFDVDYTEGNCPDTTAIKERAQAISYYFEQESCPPDPIMVSTPEPATASGLEVFPNPVSNLLTFRLPENERVERLEMMDISGRVIVAAAPGDHVFTLDVAQQGLVPGPYFYRLYTASERLITGKVVVW